jgi:citronellol/citronellal dehydrogenase
MGTLKGKKLLITGASRGIGLAIALRAAADGAAIAILAKTDAPHPKLPGTIHEAAAAVERAGGRALALKVDVRHEDDVRAAVERTVAVFGGIDACVNNAAAINLAGTLSTDMKRYDLMHSINARGAFMVSKYCLPHLLQASGPAHILMISPPLNLDPAWFAAHPAYTVSKYNMSLYAMALAHEFRGRIGVNSLWPRTTIATAAIANLLGGEAMMRRSRKPEIMGDAAHAILTRGITFTGNFCIDDAILAEQGASDLDRYSVESAADFQIDLFLDEKSSRQWLKSARRG